MSRKDRRYMIRPIRMIGCLTCGAPLFRGRCLTCFGEALVGQALKETREALRPTLPVPLRVERLPGRR